MKKESYPAARNRVIEALDQPGILSPPKRQRQFAFFSANLLNYMPSLPPEEHKAIFRKALLHQQLNSLDQRYGHEVDDSVIKGWNTEFVKMLKEDPGIICTFHTAGYRLLNSLLVKANIPFSLVVSSDVLAEQGPSFLTSFRSMKPEDANGFSMINAEEPSALLKMMRAAKAGRSLLCYVDGNTGSGDVAKRDNRLCIDFMGQSILVRKGIGLLAQLTGNRIYPILSTRLEDYSCELICKEPIRTMRTSPRDTDAKLAAETLYHHLKDLVMVSPEQWEGWFYIHHDMRMKEKELTIASSSPQELIKGHEWAVFTLDKRYFLLEKETYRSHEIPLLVYEKLREAMI